MIQRIRRLLGVLVRPLSDDRDAARREYILNVLLVGTIALSLVAFFLAAATYPVLLHEGEATGVPLSILGVVPLVFAALLVLSKRGEARMASVGMIGLYGTSALYTAYRWGVYVPQALLVFALIVVMAGVLMSSDAALIATLAIAFVNGTLFYLQSEGLVPFDASWQNRKLYGTDIAMYIATLLAIYLVSWLANREIGHALLRARTSEEALREERDLLEVKVAERTGELERAQAEKIREMGRSVQFGKLASGLFHDLMNHLSAVFLNIEQAALVDEREVGRLRAYLKEANELRGEMEGFIDVTRRQLQGKEQAVRFSLDEEIEGIVKLFGFRARQERVVIDPVLGDALWLFGNRADFDQAIGNLVANAIDAYAGIGDERERKVRITTMQAGGDAIIEVSDGGCGMPEDVRAHAFDPFFTTKGERKGLGMGLSIVKDIVRQFGGTVAVRSSEGNGSAFTVTIPIRHAEA